MVRPCPSTQKEYKNTVVNNPVTTEIKHLVFKGIDKKEQILFKSFLNLAKNELAYQVVVLRGNADTGESPDIVILDADYKFEKAEADLAKLPTIKVGSESSTASSYITRPVQWSDFKTQLTRLDIEAVAEDEGDDESRVLPGEIEFAIAEIEDNETTTEVVNEAEYAEADDYEYELDKLSIDYHSFTNSEYMKVVDDVQGFNDEGQVNSIQPGVVLVTDDESASVNSVLVIETNSLDAWEMSETEDDEEAALETAREMDADSSYIDEKWEVELTKRLESGTEVTKGEEFWYEDCEIYGGRESLIFVKTDRETVYSHFEPGKWTTSLRSTTLTKLELASKWRPSSELKAYPMSRLMWANTVANKGKSLLPGLDHQTEYILEKWPHFDLIELDNMLLKLCTMLYVNPESPYSLMQKSGYSRTIVFGFVNACQEADILREAEEFDLEKFSEMNADEGMLGKIKDVFRS